MSKNLIVLSQQLLGKFLTRQGSVKGKIYVSPDVLEKEQAQLKQYIPGHSWSTPTGGRAFEFILDDEYYIALTTVMSEVELDSICRESEGWLTPISLPGATFLHVADKLHLQPTLLRKV